MYLAQPAPGGAFHRVGREGASDIADPRPSAITRTHGSQQAHPAGPSFALPDGVILSSIMTPQMSAGAGNPLIGKSISLTYLYNVCFFSENLTNHPLLTTLYILLWFSSHSTSTYKPVFLHSKPHHYLHFPPRTYTPFTFTMGVIHVVQLKFKPEVDSKKIHEVCIPHPP